MIAISATVRSLGVPVLGAIERRFRTFRSTLMPDGAVIALVPFVGAVVLRADAGTLTIDVAPRPAGELPAVIAHLDAVIRSEGRAERVAVVWSAPDRAAAMRL